MSDDVDQWTKVLHHLDALMKQPRVCPVCGGVQWEAIGPFALDVLTFDEALGRSQIAWPAISGSYQSFLTKHTPKQQVPIAGLLCVRCAYIHFVGLGVIPGLSGD